MLSADRRRALGLVAVALTLTACSTDLTELIVIVDTDLAVPAQLDEIVVTTQSATGGVKTAAASLADSTALPMTVGLRPGADTSATVMVYVRGRLAGTEQVVARVNTHFLPGERRVLRVDLTNACIGVVCTDSQTCSRGACVPRAVDPATLPRFTGTAPGRRDDAGEADAGEADAGDVDAGPGDAGLSDAGAEDAATDAPPGCLADSDCADGDACNGVEHCDTGVCLPGTPVSCDDGIGCTVDRCTASACTHTATDAACTVSPGGTCDAMFGCQYPTCTPLNCAGDGCTSAACSGVVCERTSLCTGGSMCCGDACVAAGCDDGDPCTADACGATGCEHTVTPGAACSDRNACTAGDACDATGACVGPFTLFCTDRNPCTNDSCVARSGCQYIPNSARCDDGNACTAADVCSLGACVGGLGVACTPTIVECMHSICDPLLGCTTEPDASGTVCSDLDNCTNGDHCDAVGNCIPGRYVPGCSPA